jgi:hypothetical protein
MPFFHKSIRPVLPQRSRWYQCPLPGSLREGGRDFIENGIEIGWSEYDPGAALEWAINLVKDKEVLIEMRKLGIPENLISEISRQRAWTKFGLVDACLPRYELEISS